jgi:hypothetical protein
MFFAGSRTSSLYLMLVAWACFYIVIAKLVELFFLIGSYLCTFGRGVCTVTKKQLFSLRKLACDCEVRGHCMRKEILVIPVNKVVDKNRTIRKIGLRRRRGSRSC